MELPAGQVVYETMLYTYLMYAGLALLIAGPLLILGVWLASRFGSNRQHAGLLTSAMVKGAGVTLAGAVIWRGTLLALDYLRLGRLL